MSKAWMPFYVGDFLADTMHLSATETGIYVRLIMHCWQHGSIPRDKHKLAIIAHCDSRLWHQYEATVLRFFDVVDASTMQQKRVSTERRRSEEITNKRKAAALQKHMQNACKTDANAHTRARAPSQSHSQSSLSSLELSQSVSRETPSDGGSLATALPTGALRSPPQTEPDPSKELPKPNGGAESRPISKQKGIPTNDELRALYPKKA